MLWYETPIIALKIVPTAIVTLQEMPYRCHGNVTLEENLSWVLKSGAPRAPPP